jgi:hypothetical protein
MTRVPAALDPWIQILQVSKESWYATYNGKDLMVKMGKLVQKFEKPLFRDEFPEKMVKQISSPKSALNYHSNQTLVAESCVVFSPRAWKLDESHSICLLVGGTSPRA